MDETLKEEETKPFIDYLDQNEDRDGDDDADTKRTIGKLFQDSLPSVYDRRGLLWLAVAVFSQAAQIITLADLSKKIGATQVLFLRSCILLVTVVGISWKRSKSYNPFDIVMLTVNASAEVVFIYCTGLAAQFIWVGDITSISLNQQVPSTVLASIFLGESFNTLDGAIVVLNAIGVLFVSQPSFLFPNTEHEFVSNSESDWLGFLLAFGALTGCVNGILLYRALVYRNAEDVFLLATLTATLGLFVSSSVATIMSSWKFPESSQEWSLVLVLGILMLLTFIPFNKALETENVKTVTVLLTIVIPITTIYDFVVLGRHLNLEKIGGVLLIVGSSFAVYIKETLTSWYNT